MARPQITKIKLTKINHSQLSSVVQILYLFVFLTFSSLAKALIPNDPEFSKQWALKNTSKTWDDSSHFPNRLKSFDLDLPRAWEITTGNPGVLVAIIDTGVDLNLNDLKENLARNEVEANGAPGVDDDHNGYVDDIWGWNFVHNNNYPMDDNHHGTHIASLIAAKGNNNQGMSGVAWDIKVLPIKALDSAMIGTSSNEAKAIRYAVDRGAQIINCSFTSIGDESDLKEAVDYADAHGVLIVAGSGNEGENSDIHPEFPASYPNENIISVAAVKESGALYSYGNTGKKTVDLFAPGHGILGFFPGGSTGVLSGTSQATAFVTGVAALVSSVNPKWRASEIRKRILDSVVAVWDYKDLVATGGFLNAYAAVSGSPPPLHPENPLFWNKTPITFETDHPYKSDSLYEFQVTIPEAKRMALHFETFHFDYSSRIEIWSHEGLLSILSGGVLKDSFSSFFNGNHLTLRLYTKENSRRYGLKVDHVAWE